MFLTETKINIKTIRSTDPDFIVCDGIVITPRAGFEITKDCPREYKLIIAECINNKWLRPIAHQPIHEEFMEKLTK